MERVEGDVMVQGLDEVRQAKGKPVVGEEPVTAVLHEALLGVLEHGMQNRMVMMM